MTAACATCGGSFLRLIRNLRKAQEKAARRRPRCSCGRFGKVVDKAPFGEDGDIVACSRCMGEWFGKDGAE